MNSFYDEMYWWFKDHQYFIAAGHMANIKRYYELLGNIGRIIITHDSDGNGVILVGSDRKKILCDLDDRKMISHLLTEGAKVDLLKARQERDHSIDRLKKCVSQYYGKDLSDELEEAIIRIETIIECESR